MTAPTSNNDSRIPSWICERRIRPLAICLFRDGDRILVNRDYDNVKQDHYWRPLGGGIEYGETSEEAIRREIREEIGLPIENLRLLDVIENLFTLEGQPRAYYGGRVPGSSVGSSLAVRRASLLVNRFGGTGSVRVRGGLHISGLITSSPSSSTF